MKIERLNFYSYSIVLKSPLKMMGTFQNERSGFIIELIDENGLSGWGDAAPFPGLHKESLETVEQVFKNSFSALLKQKDNNYRSWLQFTQDLFSGTPSLCFAVQSALLMISAKLKNVLPALFVNPQALTDIKLNALLTPDNLNSFHDKIVGQGFKAVKIKVGIQSIDDEINLINSLHKKCGEDIKIRLDANRNWSFKQAVFFAKSVQKSCIEYIEEPLENPAMCPQFFAETGLNYAFDESLHDGLFDATKNYHGLSTLIIKPAVVGSFYKLSKILANAHMKNHRIIFSSTFESGIGLTAIANLAAAFAGNSVHGLDTISWFTTDTIIPSFRIENSHINLNELSKSVLNKEILKSVV
ncbi:MAG: o-succinylbenzoate synthase [Calditrichaeota bacterium]|nr:o-succinylbenzoate synthase [Calditrichota bacterium]